MFFRAAEGNYQKRVIPGHSTILDAIWAWSSRHFTVNVLIIQDAIVEVIAGS
jgi:hypothetical protein